MNRAAFLIVSCAAIPCLARAQTVPRVERDIGYAEPKNERQLLDVYAPAGGSKLPVVVWVHGGGWMRGSKNEVNSKPAAAQYLAFLRSSIAKTVFETYGFTVLIRPTS